MLKLIKVFAVRTKSSLSSMSGAASHLQLFTVMVLIMMCISAGIKPHLLDHDNKPWFWTDCGKL